MELIIWQSWIPKEIDEEGKGIVYLWGLSRDAKYVGSCQQIRVDENSTQNKIYGPMMRRCEHFREVWENRRKKGPERKVKLFSGSGIGEDWFVPIWEGLEQEARLLEEKNIE